MALPSGSYRIHVQVTDDGELAASDDKTWFINVTHVTQVRIMPTIIIRKRRTDRMF